MSILLPKIYVFTVTGTIVYPYGKKTVISHTVYNKVNVDSRSKYERKMLRLLEENKVEHLYYLTVGKDSLSKMKNHKPHRNMINMTH